MAVYFVQTESGLIKIGSANNPENRLRIFQNGSVEDLRLLGTMPGGLVREKEIHRQFEHLRIKGEWFGPESELMEFIKLYCNPKIIIFQVNGQEFPLELIDQNGDRWVTRKQLEAALGVTNLHKLHARLVKRGELKEGIHFMRFTDNMTVNPQGGNPNIIIYSYRGIIRVSMASEGQNAIDFRDWAENVLYEVIITGSYGESDSLKELKQRIEMLEAKVACIEGKSHSVKSLPAPVCETPIHAFIIAWWNTFGNREVIIRELYTIVRHDKIPLDISAKTEFGEKIRLSTLMKKLRDTRFELTLDTKVFDVTVCQTGKRNKSFRWQLKENQKTN